MKAGEVLAVLRDMAAAAPGDRPLRNAVNLLARRIAGHEHMAMEDFLRLFRRVPEAKAQRSSGSAPVGDLVADSVAALRKAFDDDDAFEEALTSLQSKKAITKAVLLKIFERLFERSDGIPTRATRQDLFTLISDERNIVVSNENMGALLGRRVVPA